MAQQLMRSLWMQRALPSQWKSGVSEICASSKSQHTKFTRQHLRPCSKFKSQVYGRSRSSQKQVCISLQWIAYLVGLIAYSWSLQNILRWSCSSSPSSPNLFLDWPYTSMSPLKSVNDLSTSTSRNCRLSLASCPPSIQAFSREISTSTAQKNTQRLGCSSTNFKSLSQDSKLFSKHVSRSRLSVLINTTSSLSSSMGCSNASSTRLRSMVLTRSSSLGGRLMISWLIRRRSWQVRVFKTSTNSWVSLTLSRRSSS